MEPINRVTLLLALILTSSTPAAAQAFRVDIPIRDVPLENGLHLYSIPIKLGSTMIEAGLDTGSPGLRIFPDTLDRTDSEQAGSVPDANFTSGVRYEGNSATGVLTLGTLTGSARFEAVNKIECQPDHTDCPAVHIPSSDYGVRGNSLTGGRFRAIFGINTMQGQVRSPLLQLGASRWVVSLPRPGETGHLILNPTDQEIGDFVRFPRLRELRGSIRDAVQGCLIDTLKRANCGPIFLDSGAPNIRLVNGKDTDALVRGTPAALVFYKSGQALAAERIVIGQPENGTALRTDSDGRMSFTAIMAGTTPFLSFDVLYDQGTDEIGLRPRQPANGSPVGQMLSH